MADFHQTGCVTTLHRLCADGTARLEADLRDFSRSRGIGLVLPALFAEFRRPAMRRIVAQLAEADYIRHIVVAIGRASRSEYEEAASFFDGFPGRVTLLWIDGPDIQDVLATLEEGGLSPGPDGKGRSCWLASGYLLACGDCDVIATHDCDIANYDRAFLARLCYPVAHPNLGFDFAKAFYPRFTDRLHGRVTRLFLTPLIRALAGLTPESGWLRFLDSFRYGLAGEFAMSAGLARVNRVPCNWGLEVGVLAEVYRNCGPRRTCQVDIADNYEHKHQSLSPNDPAQGLRRMAVDISKTLFRTLQGEGYVLTADHLRAVQVRYARLAEDMIEAYRADALINGLRYDRHDEEGAVATFTQSLEQAISEFPAHSAVSVMPNWNRVEAAIPGIFDRLLAVAGAQSELVCSQAA